MKEGLHITVNDEHFVIHKEKGTFSNTIKGSVFSTIEYYNTGEVVYESIKDGGGTEDINEARHWFDFSFCWRGVWEGRIYFKDDEYWSEEMKTISELWDRLEVFLKKELNEVKR